MTPSEVAHRFDARPAGEGRWTAKCPAHEDRSPSLSIRETSDCRVLLHCFAGCETQDVLSAVGLTFSDLFPESDRRLAGQLARVAYGTPSIETDPARRAELLLRDFADQQGRRLRGEILLRNRQITHAEKLLNRDRGNETGWQLLTDAYTDLAKLEWLASLLCSRNPRDWVEARRYVES